MRSGLKTLLLTGLLAAQASLAQDRVLEIHHQDFYEGLGVTASLLEDGRLIAQVSEEVAKIKTVKATLTYNRDAKAGEWVVWAGPDQAPLLTSSFDYTNRGVYDTESILAQQTPKSAALSALLLWEDYLASVSSFFFSADSNYGTDCPACSSLPNGCSGWFGSCNGASVRTACDKHDRCYQCGARCWGHSRSQCDSSFRQDVQGRSGSWWCGLVYWLGVRGLGWLFYQDPNARTDMQPDVYQLGISFTGCPQEYSHLCTIYVF